MTSLWHDVRTVARGWRWTRRPLVPRSAEPFVEVRDRREFPTAWARSRPGRAARDVLQRVGLKPLLWAEVQPHVAGLDRLDGIEPPVVFASNHASHLDAPLVLCALPPRWRDRTATAAAADYFFDAWWRATTTTLVFNAFPVDRGAGRITATPGRLLRAGWNLLIFPEGTRSTDGWVQRFRGGTAWLCVDQRVPAVPVAIRGTFEAMPRGRGWPRAGRPAVSVRFGTPLLPHDGETFAAFNARLQQAVARLLDEDATDWWGSLRREARGSTPAATGPPAARWRRVWEASRPLPRARSPVWRR